MIFLIRYNRDRGKIQSLDRFEDGQRTEAEKQRLELELKLNSQGIRDEVVLLEAATEAALRVTHRRYFESARQIILSATGNPGNR